MTREEQIIEKAGKESEIFYKVNDNYGDCFHGGFIDGAKWADENPNLYNNEKYHTVKVSCLDELNRKAALYDVFLEKACKWLRENVNKYSYVIKVENTEYRKVHFTDSLIEDFSKAMEE